MGDERREPRKRDSTVESIGKVVCIGNSGSKSASVCIYIVEMFV